MEVGNSGDPIQNFQFESSGSGESLTISSPTSPSVMTTHLKEEDLSSYVWGMSEFVNIMAVILTSTLTIYFGALNSRHFLRNYNILTDSNERSPESVQPVLEAKGAILMPIMGSITLITLYYLYTNLQFFILCYIVVASYASTTFCFTVPILFLLTKIENWFNKWHQQIDGESKKKSFGRPLNQFSFFQRLLYGCFVVSSSNAF